MRTGLRENGFVASGAIRERTTKKSSPDVQIHPRPDRNRIHGPGEGVKTAGGPGMLGSMKAFVCLHGFGDHSGGRRPGFSAALRRSVEARLGAKTVWKEVLWDGLLGSPDSFGTLDLALPTPALARAFYEGRAGDAVRARVAEAVRAASVEAGGAPVVLVGHSLGATPEERFRSLRDELRRRGRPFADIRTWRERPGGGGLETTALAVRSLSLDKALALAVSFRQTQFVFRTPLASLVVRPSGCAS